MLQLSFFKPLITILPQQIYQRDFVHSAKQLQQHSYFSQAFVMLLCNAYALQLLVMPLQLRTQIPCMKHLYTVPKNRIAILPPQTSCHTYKAVH